MLNPFKEVNWDPKKGDIKTFGISLMIGFPAIALLWFLKHGVTQHHWGGMGQIKFALIGLSAGILFWLFPFAGRPFYKVWFFLACCIGLVLGNILLSLFYYILVTLTGLTLRACGKEPFAKGPDKKAPTYWKDVEPVRDLEQYYKQF